MGGKQKSERKHKHSDATFVHLFATQLTNCTTATTTSSTTTTKLVYEQLRMDGFGFGWLFLEKYITDGRTGYFSAFTASMTHTAMVSHGYTVTFARKPNLVPEPPISATSLQACDDRNVCIMISGLQWEKHVGNALKYSPLRTYRRTAAWKSLVPKVTPMALSHS